MPFPEGDYTPFGYLRNPAHQARSWTQCEGGNLRTSERAVGMEWVYPWHRQTDAGAGVALLTRLGERAYRLRQDFAALGLGSRYHSANVSGFDWVAEAVAVAARFFLVDDVLCVCVDARNEAPVPRTVALGIAGYAWPVASTKTHRRSVLFEAARRDVGPAYHALVLSEAGGHPPAAMQAPIDGQVWAAREIERTLAPGERLRVTAALGRASDASAALDVASAALARAPERLAELLADDDAFHATCPELEGDWPPEWREGLVHDFETTRLLVMPPLGVFHDVWPSWMVAWPRVVLAEGVLDMLRLGYADPAVAQRAILSLFRDSPGDNVPCVFHDGGFNMVARDGSRCGTSPAWCLPFLNLRLLYLRMLDRAWLAELYPSLARYLAWWLRERTDAEGWVVYRCTWEAGEDGNPRLDPSGSGDADISGHVRPVELQATFAHAASVLAFFAGELGLADAERERWRAVERASAERTRALFDASEGRFRDWLTRERRFQEPRPEERYWGVDSRRFSPLSLTPLLGAATPTQVEALRREVRLHAGPPWTAWPSWTYALVECASAAGLHREAAEIAWSVVERVYRCTTRRTLDEHARPMPGAAPEYWPHDWREFRASDAYGWGATTANLLLRHVVGLQESDHTERWVLDLVPGMPDALLERGRELRVRRFLYRGLLLDLTYRVTPTGLEAQLDLPEARTCLVEQPGQTAGSVYAGLRPARRHVFPVEVGRRYRLSLDPPGG